MGKNECSEFQIEIQKIKEIQENLTKSISELINSKVLPEIKNSKFIEEIKLYCDCNLLSSQLAAIAFIRRYWLFGIDKNIRKNIKLNWKNCEIENCPQFRKDIENWVSSLNSDELRELAEVLNAMIIKLETELDYHIQEITKLRKLGKPFELDINIFKQLARQFDDITAIYDLFWDIEIFKEFDSRIKYLEILGLEFRKLNKNSINKYWNYSSDDFPIRIKWRADYGIIDWISLKEDLDIIKDYVSS